MRSPLNERELLSEAELLRRIEVALCDFERVAAKPYEYRSVAQGRAALDELRARGAKTPHP